MDEQAGRLVTWEECRMYALAGKAELTLFSAKSGRHYTYKVRKTRDDESSYFVSVLQGTALAGSFGYMGVLNSRGFFRTRKSRVGDLAESWRVFAWFAVRLYGADSGDTGELRVFHTGRCGHCGHRLTDLESLARGIGPECWRKK